MPQSNLYYYSPIYFFPQFFEHKEKINGYESWLSIYKIINENVCIVDRTNTIKLPVKTKVFTGMEIPIVENNFNLTYEECCSLQVKNILSIANKHNKLIRILYSGGIDSTNLLIAFIKELGYKTLSEKAIICMSRESFNENPNFYYNHIRNKLRFESSEDSMNYLDGTSIVVGGEFNDQLFGSDMLRNVIRTFGSDIIHKPLDKQFLINYFDSKIINRLHSEKWVELLFESMKKSQKQIKTIWDFFWWYNFSCKWQSIYFRILAFTNPNLINNFNTDFLNIHYHHFYNTQEFQKWSILNDSNGIKINDNWLSYKLEAKKLILNFTKDQDYFDTKCKRGSLFTILSYRKSYNAINDKFEFLKNIPNWKEFYNKTNSFI